MANPSQTSVDAVQQAYIAFYGRPADPIGLAYWANQLDANGGNLSSIIDAFGNSTESQALYGNQSPASQINAIYEQLFNRPADPTGLQYYADLLQNHKATAASLALQILDGATTGNDAQMIANKLAVAKAFTTEVAANTTDILAYQGNDSAAAVRALLSTVTYDSSTVTTAENDFGTCLTNLEHNAPGQTFTLTTGADTIVGTAGNDVINAVVDTAAGSTDTTLNAFDSIDGGKGINTLNVVDQHGDIDYVVPAGGSINNIQTLNLSATGNIGDGTAVPAVVVDTTGVNGLQTVNAVAGGNIDLNVADSVAVNAKTSLGQVDITGGSAINVTHATGDAGATNVTGEALTSVSVKGAGTVTIDNVDTSNPANSGQGTTLTSVSLDGYGAGSAVKGEALSNLSLANSANDVTVTDAATGAQTLNLTVDNLASGAVVTDATVTTLNVATAAKDSSVELAATSATALNVSGSNNLTLDGTFSTDLAKVQTITVSGSAGLNATVDGTVLTSVDASNSSGALHLQDGVVAANVTGGAGDDVVTLNAAITGTINLGAGNNSLLAGSGSIAKGAVVDGGVGGINTISATLLNATDAAQVKDFQALDLTGASGIYDNTLFANDSFTTLDVSGALLANTTVTNMAGNTINVDVTASSGADLTATLANSDKATAATGDSAVINFGASTNGANTAVADTLQSFNSTELTSVTINSNGVVHQGDVAADLANITNTLTTLTDSANDLATVTINGGEHFVLGNSVTPTDGVQVDTGASNTAGTVVQAGLKTIDASHTTGGVEITAGADSHSADGSTTITYKGLVIEGGSGQDTIVNYAVNGIVTDGDHKLDTVTLGSTAKGASATLGNGAGDTVNLNGDSQTAHVGNGAGDTVNVAGHDAIVNLGTGAADVVNVDNTASIGSVATNDHYTTINGLVHGDVLSFASVTNAGATLGDAVVLGTGVTSLDAAIAAADTGAANGTVEWFQLGGSTYVVDVVTAGTHSSDVVVKLAGTVDLSHATVDAAHGSITLA